MCQSAADKVGSKEDCILCSMAGVMLSLRKQRCNKTRWQVTGITQEKFAICASTVVPRIRKGLSRCFCSTVHRRQMVLWKGLLQRDAGRKSGASEMRPGSCPAWPLIASLLGLYGCLMVSVIPSDTFPCSKDSTMRTVQWECHWQPRAKRRVLHRDKWAVFLV